MIRFKRIEEKKIEQIDPKVDNQNFFCFSSKEAQDQFDNASPQVQKAVLSILAENMKEILYRKQSQ